MCYDDIFKLMDTFIADGSDVKSVQNVYGILQVILKQMRAIFKGGEKPEILQ